MQSGYPAGKILAQDLESAHADDEEIMQETLKEIVGSYQKELKIHIYQVASKQRDKSIKE